MSKEAHGQYTIEVSGKRNAVVNQGDTSSATKQQPSQTNSPINTTDTIGPSRTKSACFFKEGLSTSIVWALTTFHLLDTDDLVKAVCHSYVQGKIKLPSMFNDKEVKIFSDLVNERDWERVRKLLFGPDQNSDRKESEKEKWKKNTMDWYTDELNRLLVSEQIECQVYRLFRLRGGNHVAFKVFSFKGLPYESVDFMPEVPTHGRCYDALLVEIRPNSHYDFKSALGVELFGSDLCRVTEPIASPEQKMKDFYQYPWCEGGEGEWFISGKHVQPMELEDCQPHYGQENEMSSFLVRNNSDDFNEGHSGSGLFQLVKNKEGENTLTVIGMLTGFPDGCDEDSPVNTCNYTRCQSVNRIVTEFRRLFDMSLTLV